MQFARSLPHRTPRFFFILVTTVLLSVPASATVTDFEDFALDATGFYNGSDLGGDISTGGATLTNNFTDFGFGCCWDGWSVSNHSDTTTSGFGNQYSSFAGGGVGGVGQFGVLFTDSGNITLDAPQHLTGTFLTNTTYSALSMQNGDTFAKKFGGVDGTGEDFFNVTIQGFLGGSFTDSVLFYLADFRSANSDDDYIIDEWTWVDLSGLGQVDELRFVFGSSDVGSFGINTPSYTALDSLTSAIPEPNAALVFGIGSLILGQSTLRKRS